MFLGRLLFLNCRLPASPFSASIVGQHLPSFFYAHPVKPQKLVFSVKALHGPTPQPYAGKLKLPTAVAQRLKRCAVALISTLAAVLPTENRKCLCARYFSAQKDTQASYIYL